MTPDQKDWMSDLTRLRIADVWRAPRAEARDALAAGASGAKRLFRSGNASRVILAGFCNMQVVIFIAFMYLLKSDLTPQISDGELYLMMLSYFLTSSICVFFVHKQRFLSHLRANIRRSRRYSEDGFIFRLYGLTFFCFALGILTLAFAPTANREFFDQGKLKSMYGLACGGALFTMLSIEIYVYSLALRRKIRLGYRS